jgi:hypothetical protein
MREAISDKELKKHALEAADEFDRHANKARERSKLARATTKRFWPF